MRNQLIFAVSSLISPAAFWVANIYVGRYDGWGQWAAAPILLLPLLYSLGISLYGIIQVILFFKQGKPVQLMILSTLVALSPWIFTLLR